MNTKKSENLTVISTARSYEICAYIFTVFRFLFCFRFSSNCKVICSRSRIYTSHTTQNMYFPFSSIFFIHIYFRFSLAICLFFPAECVRKAFIFTKYTLILFSTDFGVNETNFAVQIYLLTFTAGIMYIKLFLVLLFRECLFFVNAKQQPKTLNQTG